MNRCMILALCAALTAVSLPVAAVAQDAAPAAAPQSGTRQKPHAPAKRTAATPRRTTSAARPEGPDAASSYQLVPTSQPTSAQARARRDAFGTPDQDSSPSDGASRRIGIGLGGGNGTTPGMQIGF